jgi:undecaprenyl-diphosphatase
LLQWFWRQESVVLLAGLVLVLTTWGFVEVAEEVVEGDARTFDERILRYLRRTDDPARPIGPGWLIDAARDVTAMGSTAVLLLVMFAVVGYLFIERKRRAMWFVAVAAGGGLLASTVLKYLFGRDRPDVVLQLAPVATPSFPSGHSMLSAVVYMTLGALMARLVGRGAVKAYVLSVALLLTFLVGISRIYLGVHYPTDVLAGWSAGLAWALLCWLMARYVQRRGSIEAPGDGRQ